MKAFVFTTILGILGIGLSFASSSTVQVSSDPYTTTDAQHKTEVEPDSFAFGSTIVSAFQVGRIFSGGCTNIGWATSQDGGTTWAHGFLSGITKNAGDGAFDRTSDASVAYDAKHDVWMISYLGINTVDATTIEVPAVLASRSTDGGLTWSSPVTVASTGGSGFYDKNWTVCDNSANSKYYGNCYTEWDSNSQGNLILMSTSSDGGATWGAAKSTANKAAGLGGQPLVQPNGTVIVPIGSARLSKQNAFISTDGGASWSSTVTISSVQDQKVGGNLRSEPLVSAEIDGDGNVYVVWQDCSFEKNCATNDIVMSTSADGTNWSKVVRIPLDAVGSGVDHFIPGIAVDPSTAGASAHLHLTYYYYPKGNCTNDCELNVGTVFSVDGGKSWSNPQQIAGPLDPKNIPQTSQGVMVGDYISSSFVSGSAHPTVALTGGNELAMFSASLDLKAAQEMVAVKRDRILSRNGGRKRTAVLTLN